MGKCIRCGAEDPLLDFSEDCLCRACAEMDRLSLTDTEESPSLRPSRKAKSCLKVLKDYVAIDVETTGRSPENDEIIEFAAVLVENGVVVNTFSSLANSDVYLPSNITQITGITEDMLSSAPPLADVLADFLGFIGDMPLVGHNVSFDVNFISNCAKRILGCDVSNDRIDTLRISRRAVKHLPDHKLCTLARYYNIENPHAHRALGDALTVHQLYERLKGYIFCDDVLPESCVFGGYTPECIYNSIQQMIGDDDNVVLKRTKTSTSIIMYGVVVFTIRINSRTQCLDCKSALARDYVKSIPGASVSGDIVHIPIASGPDSLCPISDLVNELYKQRRSAIMGESFACCNDFVRCSDKGRCLKLGQSDYAGCAYRRNLDEGRIFYGKNASATIIKPEE